MRIKLKKIEITRAEGPIHSCGIKHEFKDYISARQWLWSNAHGYPKQGYDKHDVSIEFEDGWVFHTRMDCQHYDNEHPDLDPQEHLLNHLHIYGGIRKPLWMDDKKWEYFKTNDEVYAVECKRILDNYEI